MLTWKSVEQPNVTSFQGDIYVWSFGNHTRRYMSTDMEFGAVRRWFKVEVYNSETGDGWHRSQIDAHVRKLAGEIESGRFTPVSWTAGLTSWHVKNLFWPAGNSDNRMVGVKITTKNPLPLIDGWQRFCALELLLQRAACASPS